MRNAPFFLALCILLLSGCAELGSMRITQDRPDDLATLLESQEFARARQLTGKYPSIDTIEVQAMITNLESAYEDKVYEQAKELGAGEDLLGAVTLLTDALQRVPHSTKLRAMRADYEQQRALQVKVNERNMLLTRAEYLLEQRDLYQQQVKLQPPGRQQEQEYARQQSESGDIAARLVEHAEDAIQQGDNGIAKTCLQSSLRLNESARAAQLLEAMQQQEQAERKSSQQAATTRQARIQRNRTRDEQSETRQLLEASQQALVENKLQAAQAALAQIPPSTSSDSEVRAAQSNLVQAVNTRVNDLMMSGDAQYRAEQILPALKTWTEALSLDPNNPELLKRVDRANKVLANLEALKSQQQK
jgi:hypothetical protein